MTRRHEGLDLLRFVAIVLVLGRHLTHTLPTSPFLHSFFESWKRGGWVGVDLFFVLSGFLVSGLLFTEYKRDNKISVSRFFIRRGWKIYPPFCVFILFTVLVDLRNGTAINRRALIVEATFLQSYFDGLWPHTWSLSVEEHFYILLPLALLLTLAIKRKSSAPFRNFATGLGVLACLELGLRMFNASHRQYSHLTHLYPSYLRLDALGFGVAVAYFYHFHGESFSRTLMPWRYWLAGTGVILLTPAFWLPLETTPYVYTVGLTVNYIGSGMLLVTALLTDFAGRRGLRLLAAAGAYSYSIYLWHLAVGQRIPHLMIILGNRESFWLWFTLYLSGSFAVGIIMSKLIEIPALRLRDRWFPSRSGAITPRQDRANRTGKSSANYPSSSVLQGQSVTSSRLDGDHEVLSTKLGVGQSGVKQSERAQGAREEER